MWKNLHTICFSGFGVIFGLDVLEEKDDPPKAIRKENDSKGKALGLCLYQIKYLHGTGCLVVWILRPASTYGVEKSLEYPDQ